MLEFGYDEEVVRIRTDDSSLLLLKAIEQKKREATHVLDYD
jgi:hypothetical protein